MFQKPSCYCMACLMIRYCLFLLGLQYLRFLFQTFTKNTLTYQKFQTHPLPPKTLYIPFPIGISYVLITCLSQPCMEYIVKSRDPKKRCKTLNSIFILKIKKLVFCMLYFYQKGFLIWT